MKKLLLIIPALLLTTACSSLAPSDKEVKENIHTYSVKLKDGRTVQCVVSSGYRTRSIFCFDKVGS